MPIPLYIRLESFTSTMTATKPNSDNRTSQEKIDAILRPKWCETYVEGRHYWDLICAAIRNDVETIRDHLKAEPDCARLEFWYTPPIHFAVREGNLDATRILWKAYPYDEVTDLIRMAEDRSNTGVADFLRASIGAVGSQADLRLHQAVEAGNQGKIERLLTEVPGIGVHRDSEGRTALHVAVIAKNQDAVRALVARGIDIDAADHFGFRAVHYTCWTNQYWTLAEKSGRLLETLLNAGAADSPTLAAARGDMDAVRTFIAADPAFVNDGEALQKRPISAAVERGRHQLVRYLLDQGGNPSLPEGRMCPHGSALMTASVKNDIKVARWLLEASADPNGDIDSSGTPAIRASSDAMRGLMYEYRGCTGAAWGFAQSGNLETLAAILRYCADPFSDEESEYLTTPYTAIISGCRRRLDKKQSTDAHEAMLSMFLRRGHPTPTVLTECKSYLYHVPHMTRQLLGHGLDPNLPDWQRRTPLHDLSAGIRHVEDAPELMQLFIDHGADIDAIDEEDRSTPLGIAAREGQAEFVDLLLANGADPNAAGANWAKPLAWAERRG
ncbi:MAG: ankyrin repeat domain-containing protein, partial [Candidatus Poribacteria bacterium]|nr:ankyrin repeat domain-containing protein [Candidatus Poribacteria bacterium]